MLNEAVDVRRERRSLTDEEYVRVLKAFRGIFPKCQNKADKHRNPAKCAQKWVKRGIQVVVVVGVFWGHIDIVGCQRPISLVSDGKARATTVLASNECLNRYDARSQW